MVCACAGRARGPARQRHATAATARAGRRSARRALARRAKLAGRPAADAVFEEGRPPRRGGRTSGGGGQQHSRARGGLNGSRLGSARLGSARLGSARLGSARLGSARLGSARLGSARLGSARLGSARLGSARLGSARLGSARLGSAHSRRLKTLTGCQVFCRAVHPCSPSASLRPGHRARKETAPIVLTVVPCRLQPRPMTPASRASSRCRKTLDRRASVRNVERTHKQTWPRYHAAYTRLTDSEN